MIYAAIAAQTDYLGILSLEANPSKNCTKQVDCSVQFDRLQIALFSVPHHLEFQLVLIAIDK
jgi:hypothetical protein